MVPVVGKLADIFGRKVFYLGGLGLFVAGSVLSGAAQTMGQLIAFRALQGLGGVTRAAASGARWTMPVP